MERKAKTVFQLESPFTKIQWPEISQKVQENILDLLCNTLASIGVHCSNHVVPSKGKRDRKRKRKEAKDVKQPPLPSPPDISLFVVVGLNSILRNLELLSQTSKPEAIRHVSEDREEVAQEKPSHFSAIFVAPTTQLSIIHTHLPQLIQTASLAHQELPPTRLVELPKGSEARLCVALGLARVSFIGIMHGAPHSKALMDLVLEYVPEVDIPWLKEVKTPSYLPLKVNVIETFTSTAGKEQPKS